MNLTNLCMIGKGGNMTELEIQKRLLKQEMYIDCPVCKGEGENYGYECSACKGTGKVRKSHLIKRKFKKVLL